MRTFPTLVLGGAVAYGFGMLRSITNSLARLAALPDEERPPIAEGTDVFINALGVTTLCKVIAVSEDGAIMVRPIPTLADAMSGPVPTD